MKELQSILKAVSGFEKDNQKAILATVVDLKGSGYRRPGARMLIDSEGRNIGTVSGGCLEADVLERAKKVLQTGESTVITYDTTKDEDSVFGLGMGCRGIIRILLEATDTSNDFFTITSNNLRSRMPVAVATLISTNDKKLNIGAKLFLDKSGITANNFDEQTTADILPAIHRNFADESTALETFDFGELFIETIKPPLNLLLFGAGYDALPVIKFAKELGWLVTAIDHRPAFANAERLPEADRIIVSSSEDLSEEVFQDENSIAVIMTHNYERDRNILRLLLSSKCRYVGALGPKRRMEKLLDEIEEDFSPEQLQKLHAPIGLDIGATTPEEIALSIISEIRAVLANREGGFLRRRQGSIYGRPSD